MKAVAKLISIVAIPLAILNGFGGVVSGIWLAVLGKWTLIGYGIAAFFISGILLGLAMAPGLLFAAPAVAMLERGNKFGGYAFGLLSALYTTAVLIIWSVAVLMYFISYASHDSIVPILIWSYGVAVGPITWIAQKELGSGNENAMIPTFFIQLAYVITILAILFFGITRLDVFIIFAVMMSISLFIQFYLAYLVDSAAESYY